MAELRVPTLDFSALGNLPKTYKAAQNESIKAMTLDQLGRGEIDQGTATQRLLAVDPQMGMSLAQLSNNQRDYAFRESEAARAQQNADRNFGLQERQIAATAGNTAAAQSLARQQFEWQKEQGSRPDIREVTDAAGNKSLVLVDRKTNAVTPVQVPGSEAGSAGNPFGSGKFNETQGKAAGFADRMLQSEGILQDWKGSSLRDQHRADVSDLIGYNLRSPEFQKFDQAQRDFTNAVLRRESGAAISATEFDNARKQYFPVPGDTPDVLRQKALNRRAAIESIGREGGPSYAPKFNYGTDGRVAPVGGKPQTQAPASQSFKDGMTATNPQTGQRIIFRGGQWVPAQ